jgi:hypothetical protein
MTDDLTKRFGEKAYEILSDASDGKLVRRGFTQDRVVPRVFLFLLRNDYIKEFPLNSCIYVITDWGREYLGQLSKTLGGPRLPSRTLDTMGEAIALSSPSGRMSKRARKVAERRLSTALFGEAGLAPPHVSQGDPVETLLRRARELRDLAARGMRPRAHVKEAERLEAQAEKMRVDDQSTREAK